MFADPAFKYNLTQTIDVDVNDYSVKLHMSKAPCLASDSTTHMTIDVVQIGWTPVILRERKLEQKPKRSVKYVWDALELVAKLYNRSLKVECIQSKKLVQMLTEERGYIACYGSINDLVRVSE